MQRNALLELEKHWDSADIFVVNLPVASGKSAIAMTIARWAGKATVITPNKMLVDQYKSEYPNLQVLRSKENYFCDTYQVTLNQRPVKKDMPSTCASWEHCEGCDNYKADIRKAHAFPYVTANYHIYMAHKLYKPVLVVDEAHQLIPMIKQMASRRIWQFYYRFPSTLDTREKIKRWVNSLTPERFKFHWNKAGDDRKWAEQEVLQFLKDEVNSPRPQFLVRMDTDTYGRNQEEIPCIRMEPLDIRGDEAVSIMLPRKVKKIVLMSATISRKDIEQLGISDRKIVYIQASSPIDSERRPVVLDMAAAQPINYNNQDRLLPELAKYVEFLAEHHKDEKGLIHLTYGLAKKLRTMLDGDRYIWHDQNDKRERYQEYRDATEPKILIASGMYEGIDLPYDAGRWQVIGKIPWPSLAEPAIKYLTDLDPEYYAWETIKVVQQACGRICRTPTDYGVTYIWDKTFLRLLEENPDFWPDWWTSSFQKIGDDNANL